MPKQLNVDLRFNADTSQAKKEIQQLQESLNNLLKTSAKNSSINEFTKGVGEAQQSIIKLQTALNNSLNMDTGKLDLSKFNQQLDKSGLSIGKLANQMNGLGVDGQKAFLNLANSIVTAQKPLMQTNKMLDEMWTALKNTARWQLSSSILHGFMGALQGAYGYAQDLNKSLTDIAIVTERSVDDMRTFAETANKAAQALSANTLAYADAALIFYQQGLPDEQVKERTDTVIKLSQTSGESAEQISSYMTSIWNNFAQGSDNLEYYADVISYLGAATAASNAEIAEGMQSFAATANTVGLSYEYAATAMTVLRDVTQQSASTIGNSLKTIFARLSSLKLGETLEDGTDLTKYTKALQTVGVEVLDANGNLKDMDSILDSLAERWETLSSAQKSALAQTVGGVRQYNQIITLMDNYDKFQELVGKATDSGGFLQKQQEIYADSWEAAANRVKAAWQAIYQDLIDDKFFTGLLNTLAGFLKGVDGLIDRLGGLGGTLTLLGAIGGKVFKEQLINGVNNFQQALRVATGAAQREADAMTEIVMYHLDTLKENDASNIANVEITGIKDQIGLNKQLKDVYDQLNGTQKEFAANLIENVKNTHSLYLEAVKVRDASLDKTANAKVNIKDTYYDYLHKNEGNTEKTEMANSVWNRLNGGFKRTSEWEKLISTKSTDTYQQNLEKLIKTYSKVGAQIGLTTEQVRKYITAEAELAKNTQRVADLEGIYKKTLDDTQTSLKNIKTAIAEGKTSTEEMIVVLNRMIAEKEKDGKTTEEEIKKLIALRDALEEDAKSGVQNLNANKIVQSAQAISQITAAISTLSSGIKALNDDTLKTEERVGRFFQSLLMSLPMLWGGLQNLAIAIGAVTTETATFSGVLGGLWTKLLVPMLTSPWFWLIAALGGVVAWAIHSSKELERLREKADESKKAFEETHQAYDDLYDSITNHEKALKAINELKRGTEEWNKAVQKNNEDVLALIDKFPELAAGLKNIGGVLEIDPNTMGWVLDKQYEDLTKKQISSINDNIAVNNKEYEDQRSNTASTITWSEIDNPSNTHAATANQLQHAVDIYQKTNGAAFASTEALIEALRENGYTTEANSSELVEALYKNRDKVKELSDAQNKFNTLSDAQRVNLATSGVNNEIGGDIESIIGDNPAIAGRIQERLTEEVLATFENAEEITYDAYQQALQEARNNFAANSNKYIEAAEKDLLSRQTEAVGQSDSYRGLTEGNLENYVKSFYDGLSEKDKTLFLQMEIDPESFVSLEQSLADYKEQLNENIEDIRSNLDEDVDEAEWETLTDYIRENADEINKNAKAQERLSEELLTNRHAAAKLAEAILRFDDAIQDVTNNYDTWMAMLKSGSVEDAAKAGAELADAYGDLLNIDGSELSASFRENTDNLELMKQAINGNEDAYNKLLQLSGEDVLVKVGLDKSRWETDRDDIYNQIMAFKDQDFGSLTVGAELNDQAFLDKLSEMLTAAGFTAEQAQNYLASMGINAKITQHDAEAEETTETASFHPELTEPVTTSGYVGYMDGATAGIQELPYKFYGVNYVPDTDTVTTKKQTSGFTLQVESAEKSSGGEFKYQHASHGGGSSRSGGGGSKTTKKTVQKPQQHVKNVSEKDRYHNIKEQIEDLNTEMDRLNKNKDRAYGKDRIKYMDQEIDRTKQQIDLTQKYIKEIKAYAKEDKKALEKSLAEIGMSQKEIADQFGPDGILKDYEGLLDAIQKKFDETATASYNSAIDAYNRAVDAFNNSSQDDAAKETFDNAKNALDAAKEVYDKQKEQYEDQLKNLKQYEDTINLWQEKRQEEIDQMNDLADRLIEKAGYKFEIKLDLDQDAIDHLSWLYDNLGDSADKAVDRIANLTSQLALNRKAINDNVNSIKEMVSELLEWRGYDKNGNQITAKDLGLNTDELTLDPNDPVAMLATVAKIQEMFAKADAEFDATSFVDKLSEIRDELMDQYNTLKDIDEQVTENLVNAFDEWNEKVAENLELMDHYDSVIDSYKAIADLLGEEQTGLFGADILYEDSKLHNQQNLAAAAKDQYDAVIKARQEAEENLLNATSETEKKRWQEILDQRLEAEREAEEEYLKRWEDALRQAEEIYQNSLERNAKAYQKTLGAQFGNLDNLSEQLEMQKELDNLYLDDYEKYKKLGDLTANINKSLANNPNIKIQQKMKDLLDDVNAKMADGQQISEGEATILEKRLMLLQAEDQIMAARNAKSAVRMTRDNEGNFSYTYTADADKIQDAQQNYADKFYDLLDYERQYADDTQAQMLQSWQDFLSKRDDILNDDMLSDEERNRALEKLKGDYAQIVDYYTDELQMVTDEMGRLKTEDWKDIEELINRPLAAPDDFQTSFAETPLGQLVSGEWGTPDELYDAWFNAANAMYEADEAAKQKWIASNEETNRRVDTTTAAFAEQYTTAMGTVTKASDDAAKAAETLAEEMPGALEEIGNAAKDFDAEYGEYLDNIADRINNITTAINLLKETLGEGAVLSDYVEAPGVSNTGAVASIASGASGMYTGAWGTGGKLAILHEKELVLNKEDTANLLQAVNFIRNIPAFQSANLGGSVNYNTLAGVGTTDLQQQVHIDASFPNVQSHTEIELALNNLINSATQYVNRK